MKVVSVADRGHASLIERPLPRISKGFALVKVLVAPMCNEYVAYSKFEFRDRNRRDSLGHEAAGEISAIAGDSKFRIGDRVVALSGYACGQCAVCEAGAYGHCEFRPDPLEMCGSPSGDCCFAQYAIKQESLLFPVPGDLSLEHASMACCGLGPTFTAMEKMAVTKGETILVTGLGPLGLGAVINGVFRGARVIAAARSPYRTKLGKELGAELVVDPRDPLAAERLRSATRGMGVDYALECSSMPIYQRFALDSTRRLGAVTFLGESGAFPLHIDNDLIQKGLTLVGSLETNLKHLTALMKLIRSSRCEIDKFITHRFHLAQVSDAWEIQVSGNCGKILLLPWGD